MFSSPQWREDRQRRNKSSKDRGPIGLDIVEFKLSQKTFKKTVLQKQELYRLNIRNQISEKKQSIHGSSRAGRSTLNSRDNQNAGETGNLNHFTVNKGFFVNRDM